MSEDGEIILGVPYFLALDIGLTLTKAVIFTLGGKVAGSGTVFGKNISPYPNWVERDMNSVWKWVCLAIKQAVDSSGISPSEVKAVGITAHGDGVYLVDKGGAPIREGIVSLDTRAMDIIEAWRRSSTLQEYLGLTGHYPFEGAPAPLLAWIRKHEPEIYRKIGWVLSCKDWVRYRMTGEILTDFTDASSSFTNVEQQIYDPEVFKLLGLVEMAGKVPPIKMPAEIAGKVTSQAAEETGLVAGIPVATGLHDANAGAIGTGCIHPGQALAISGTWSVNRVITDQPSSNPSWNCKNFIAPGLWVNYASSPASATNLEWFIQNLCREEIQKAGLEGKDHYEFANQEVASVVDQVSKVFFLPFIYGSPVGGKPSACFLGIKGWHTRAHLLKAIYEGVIFNHKYHIESLRSAGDVYEVRLAGGSSKSSVWCQLFANALDLPVLVSDVSEAGALGAMICASAACGYFDSIDEAVEKLVNIDRIYEPDPEQQVRLADAYETYQELCEILSPMWDKIG